MERSIYLSDIESDGTPTFRGKITIDGIRYIVKKKSAITEHIASYLMNLMRVPAHNTFLACIAEDPFVFCADFTPRDMTFIPASRLFEELFPGTDIMDIYDAPHLKKVFEKYFRDNSEKELTIFVHKLIFDCIIKEEDFSPGNWGVLQDKDTKKMHLAPFYNNAETMQQLVRAIDNNSFSLEKAIDYALGEYNSPFISFRNGAIRAKEGLEDITNKVLSCLKDYYTVEIFCTSVKKVLSSVSHLKSYLRLYKEAGMFLYTALVLRYLHVMEGLGKSELLEVAKNIPQY